MPFDNLENERTESERKKNVVANILAVQVLIGQNSLSIQLAPGSLGEGILNDLPSTVGDFKYSDNYPNIAASRNSGSESWNAKSALEWGLDGLPEQVEANLRGRIGEIR